ncbi:hypothetical protein F5Y14DRAFT_415242 [Nemania sp. NC0429]|nr:hypothetical protein F5Y14DRAFT_415242 [Nemania sp. NC0429]
MMIIANVFLFYQAFLIVDLLLGRMLHIALIIGYAAERGSRAGGLFRSPSFQTSLATPSRMHLEHPVAYRF